MMANRSEPGEGYTTERVEIRPGVFIKMSPADKAAWEARQPQPAERATAEPPERAVQEAPKPRKRS